MSSSLRKRERRARLLAGVLRQSGAEKTGDGIYDALTSERHVFLGTARGSPEARMVSWHESFHGFLNASTCHGNAMLLAGSLATAGYERFNALVERMIDVALITHETYATVTGISAATGAVFDEEILRNYPSYQAFLRSFLNVFPHGSQPVLSVMALTSCARVAIQTPIYEPLLAGPCETWPDIDVDAVGAPDRRFARLMTRPFVDRAIAAMHAALREAGEPYASVARPDIDAATERRIWQTAKTSVMATASEAAFVEFAEILTRDTGKAPGFGDQKIGIGALITKVEAFAGDRLKTQFRTPASEADDEHSLLMDFRQEQLILMENPLPATIASLATHQPSTPDLFVLSADGQQYVQFIAMPLGKARMLYDPLDGADLLNQGIDDVIACLRRRWAPPDMEPRVELFSLGPSEAPPVIERLTGQGVTVFAVITLSVLREANWVVSWLSSAATPVKRLAVLIDDDPIELIDRHGKRGAALHFGYFQARSAVADDAHTEVLSFLAADEPDTLYFTPCTTPFRQASIEYAQRRFDTVSLGMDFLKPWLPMLQRVISHTLREEGRFGDRFWI
ncbi:hypothetical protein AWB68_05866 [Caballeronia choica]|uniref:Uncharacterized protein n=1 Tax=Caballeronia choica TaxID=326476 RepID=A0A158KH58_9BURK|nr:hypothetical protein [Caballeronia choica]SAL80478.1 hypothetical protein AWB68_05866 [Caballeronia choica]